MMQNQQESLKKQQNWEEQIQKWQESGLNQTAYCRLYEIDIKRFVYWQKRLEKERFAWPSVKGEIRELHIRQFLVAYRRSGYQQNKRS